MKRIIFATLVSASIVVLASSAPAQESPEAQDAAAVLNAKAAAAAAEGQAVASKAEAEVQDQSARALALQNESYGVREWYTLKQYNSELRAARNRTNPEITARVAELKRPDRLTYGQYQRRTGWLVWPAVLMDPLFDDERVALDRAFSQRGPEDFGENSQFYRGTQYLCRQMHDKMVDSINQLSPTESISARKFLRSLEYEARIPVNEFVGLASTKQQLAPRAQQPAQQTQALPQR